MTFWSFMTALFVGLPLGLLTLGGIILLIIALEGAHQNRCRIKLLEIELKYEQAKMDYQKARGGDSEAQAQQ